ncbi:flagellar basal body P-ring formation chaperone FlgA [Pseudoduganella plicata]|uniref:Flagella basal body P-ring formation protein FlgA n=1 Tax=Pseudoduganella plicata TaxID=321984 RepID=A0A4P7BD28_9BURK|nr:flagellar basal body P-ring formation chaperone FlgA [Pseudoduganella plicata]QBQ36444.1 flagellar basal body P-ring formation protein FlgA [Pseudoduganella plicata]GGY75348.1 flagellar basal body P-ring biosynthesis protein FlgA [Pseudoduganella plicata]
MKTLTSALLLSAITGAASAAQIQDPAKLRQTVDQFLQVQSAGLPGKVTVTVGNVDGRMKLAACPAPEAFLMPGSKPWGKTTVGVRCAAPSPWTVYIQANVSVLGHYIAAASPVPQGQPIVESQLATIQGDLTTLPASIATDKAQVLGRTSNIAISAGMPLRLDSLRIKPVVQTGQLVRLVSSGPGFKVSAEAKAVANAADGQVVQVRTAGGQHISGIARAGGMVEVAF